MKKLLCLVAILLISLATSCKKKNSGNNNTNNNTVTPTACNGMNLCFKMNGTGESHDAVWKLQGSYYRIYWEQGSGSNFENIELDIYGTTPGTYTVSAYPTAGLAGFQYFINDYGNVKIIKGQSGTVEITGINGSEISGTFTITASDGSTTYEITEGNFIAVPQ